MTIAQPMPQTETPGAKPIRSFVRRQGRITLAQQAALENLLPLFSLEPTAAFSPAEAFGRDAPLILEIGFGNGESLAQMALAAPEKDFLGIEVHRPGVGHLLLKVEALGLRNVRVYCADAVEILRDKIGESSLDGAQVFFPDPWHKKRHHKRRLINPGLVALLANRLKLGGVLHCATDWEPYAEHMLDVLEECPLLRNQAGKGSFSGRPAYRPLTKFEKRGHGLGHQIRDLLFEKV
jgi:tRNA (guanine-N7-)-methyltransferase